ncbi:HEPN domain protein [Limihaloglobus sulfuriphilus]|uniref:HEPN domain protein n=1 Tax=Limihaloglobus sulfuriphilus TaxID=1851148 RepID=A0A1Q2MFP4_9BACT|nr:HEPN domain-containing protein [Limihaloglobus sulfuriphilus]AQQ71516.1 HEPN domain protein [Limihaloglobus sulfuriphilus]
MADRTLAKEWLTKAWHDLTAARVLFDAGHYMDVIGAELQQAIEKTLKAYLAYASKKIKKTHILIEIAEYIRDYIEFSDDEIRLLLKATKYYMDEKYPIGNIEMPDKAEVGQVLEFAEKLFKKTADKLEIESFE